MSFAIPMRRLKNTTVSSASPKSKRPARSRKNSRFSGKKRLKRVRLIWTLSASTWAKSGLRVASSVRFEVIEYLKSRPRSLRVSVAGATSPRRPRTERPLIAKGFTSM